MPQYPFYQPVQMVYPTYMNGVPAGTSRRRLSSFPTLPTGSSPVTPRAHENPSSPTKPAPPPRDPTASSQQSNANEESQTPPESHAHHELSADAPVFQPSSNLGEHSTSGPEARPETRAPPPRKQPPAVPPPMMYTSQRQVRCHYVVSHTRSSQSNRIQKEVG